MIFLWDRSTAHHVLKWLCEKTNAHGLVVGRNGRFLFFVFAAFDGGQQGPSRHADKLWLQRLPRQLILRWRDLKCRRSDLGVLVAMWETLKTWKWCFGMFEKVKATRSQLRFHPILTMNYYSIHFCLKYPGNSKEYADLPWMSPDIVRFVRGSADLDLQDTEESRRFNISISRCQRELGSQSLRFHR